MHLHSIGLGKVTICTFCFKYKSHHRVFSKILSMWQKLWSRWRRKKTRGKGATCQCPKSLVTEKILKSGHLRMHFQHPGAKIRVFEQNTDIIKFWLFYSVTLLNWVNLQREVGGKFMWNSWQFSLPPAFIENPASHMPFTFNTEWQFALTRVSLGLSTDSK